MYNIVNKLSISVQIYSINCIYIFMFRCMKHHVTIPRKWLTRTYFVVILIYYIINNKQKYFHLGVRFHFIQLSCCLVEWNILCFTWLKYSYSCNTYTLLFFIIFICRHVYVAIYCYHFMAIWQYFQYFPR